jgi:hypothetical protein
MTFPLTGRSVVLDYGDLELRYDFGVEGKLTYTGLSGPAEGHTDTVDIDVVPIRDDIHVVTFRLSDGTQMVSVEDLTQQLVNTFITTPDLQQHHLRAMLRHE